MSITVDRLGRNFYPKVLFVRVVEVYKLGEEENDSCTPENYEKPVDGGDNL